MEWKIFATVFATVFLAELGDKTQLATVLFAAKGEISPWTVFIAAALALTVSAGIGVLAGQWISDVLQPKLLQSIAGMGFVLIGLWTLWAVWK
ncbi:MAG: TMEM165/GDT1 family protein [Xanthomonadales bacterium]|nr:TMEM165/GDT1 family protein [Xanthomonadales bacterium]